jgi:hypothetical protein
VDLPGEWEQTESSEAGAMVYREVDGPGSLVVLLLAVRPVYAIADRRRLLEDYLKHRSTYENAQDPALTFAAPVVADSEAVEGGWSAADAVRDRRMVHRTMLVDKLLADFRFETSGLDEAAFAQLAGEVLQSATVSAE